MSQFKITRKAKLLKSSRGKHLRKKDLKRRYKMKRLMLARDIASMQTGE